MQPYFFPYLGHFSLIAAVDEWVVFDITQYTPKTWMSRNRILHPTSGWQYVTVPLSNSSISIKTFEAQALDLPKTKVTTLGKLSHYKKSAPYYRAVTKLVHEVFDSATDNSLVHLNVRGLLAICSYLDIPFTYKICSELDLKLPATMGPGEWAPEICSRLGATGYINPVSGRDIFDQDNFRTRGITLNFAKTTSYTYDTGPYQHEENLSILDVLMWNAPATVAKALRENIVVLE